ncbi:Cas10/Cmr2 second palm domain-containing protein [Ornithinimicrobium avium]|uniref:Cas10/Cmr2 second palm domain-containing protein n=1 Tax=Ornithinimicrobium avium TaxID=2283195 RepID=A0A345NLQ5_9MICO|nr:hypothetical protein [Ornithinimicrobium avium]AXH95963.1 hypothetical protein DV701_07355 [Ornithinimicrobium avium]
MSGFYFVDVGVGGIQQWLSRSSNLQGLRGASSMLAGATDMRAWAARLKEDGTGWEWNAEAGNVSGVVSLRAATPTVKAEHQAAQVLQVLRNALPAATLQAHWSPKPQGSYAQFRVDTARQASSRSQPALMENPAARPCSDCRQSAASPRGNRASPRLGSGEERCDDCWARDEHALLRARERAWSLRPLWGDLKMSREGLNLRVPDDLGALARLGEQKTGSRPGDASTRVAVVSADGNAVGQFVAEASSLANKDKVALIIDTATREAILAATGRHCLVHDPARPGTCDVAMIPHIVGGDDILASVSAHVVWDFVNTLWTEFSARMDQHWKQLGIRRSIKLPTLSVGVAIHHARRPLRTAIEDAEHCLASAKRSGEGAWLAWSDSVAGDSSLAPPAPRPAAWVDRNLAALRQLASTPLAHRAMLRTVLNDVEDREEAVQVISEVTRRHGTRECMDALVGPEDSSGVKLGAWRWALQIATDLTPEATA